MSHLQLDQAQIDRARDSARRIARQVFDDMSGFTTTTVERATLRLMGVDGVDETWHPAAQPRGEPFAGRKTCCNTVPPRCWRVPCRQHGLTAQQVAEAVSSGSLTLTRPQDEAAARAGAQSAGPHHVRPHRRAARPTRPRRSASSGEGQGPLAVPDRGHRQYP